MLKFLTLIKYIFFFLKPLTVEQFKHMSFLSTKCTSVWNSIFYFVSFEPLKSFFIHLDASIYCYFKIHSWVDLYRPGHFIKVTLWLISISMLNKILSTLFNWVNVTSLQFSQAQTCFFILFLLIFLLKNSYKKTHNFRIPMYIIIFIISL